MNATTAKSIAISCSFSSIFFWRNVLKLAYMNDFTSFALASAVPAASNRYLHVSTCNATLYIMLGRICLKTFPFYLHVCMFGECMQILSLTNDISVHCACMCLLALNNIVVVIVLTNERTTFLENPLEISLSLSFFLWRSVYFFAVGVSLLHNICTKPHTAPFHAKKPKQNCKIEEWFPYRTDLFSHGVFFSLPFSVTSFSSCKRWFRASLQNAWDSYAHILPSMLFVYSGE